MSTPDRLPGRNGSVHDEAIQSAREHPNTHNDLAESPARSSSGPVTPGFASSFSSIRSINSIPPLSSSSSQSHLDTSPSSASSNKFEHAFGLSPSYTHPINDTQLFEAFANTFSTQDHTRSIGARFSEGNVELGSSADTLRPRSLSGAGPTTRDIGDQMGALHVSGRSKARPIHTFGSAFSPLSPVDPPRK